MESIGADLEVMKRVPLADEHVRAMCAIGHERAYHKGEMVAKIGQPHDTFVYVIEGEIEVVDPFSGERLLESSLGPTCLLYTSPSPRDATLSRMPSSA